MLLLERLVLGADAIRLLLQGHDEVFDFLGVIPSDAVVAEVLAILDLLVEVADLRVEHAPLYWDDQGAQLIEELGDLLKLDRFLLEFLTELNRLEDRLRDLARISKILKLSNLAN